MNQKNYLTYLKSIDINTTDLIKKVSTVYDNCQKICPEKFQDLFIDEYINDEGARVYEAVTFFSRTYVVVASLFSKDDEFSIAKFGTHRFAVRIQPKDYDFEKATAQSRLYVERRDLSTRELIGWFKASKENCDTLMKILNKYTIPNMLP